MLLNMMKCVADILIEKLKQCSRCQRQLKDRRFLCALTGFIYRHFCASAKKIYQFQACHSAINYTFNKIFYY